MRIKSADGPHLTPSRSGKRILCCCFEPANKQFLLGRPPLRLARCLSTGWITQTTELLSLLPDRRRKGQTIHTQSSKNTLALCEASRPQKKPNREQASENYSRITTQRVRFCTAQDPLRLPTQRRADHTPSVRCCCQGAHAPPSSLLPQLVGAPVERISSYDGPPPRYFASCICICISCNQCNTG